MRTYQKDNIRLEIPPQVFHPGFFFSTQILLDSVKQLPLQNARFLEPGCGSGFISIYAAKNGACVTASDINPIAVDYLKKNSVLNGVRFEIIQSDLFTDLREQLFDIIAINPPYYKKDPQTPAEHAWYCGQNGEYFRDLFKGLPHHIHKDSTILMVLFEGCDMNMIMGMAAQNSFELQLVHTRRNLLEKNFIYKIEMK